MLRIPSNRKQKIIDRLFKKCYNNLVAIGCNVRRLNMSKKVTIYTLAEELNMTPSSVSRAFNPNANINAKKRQLVLEAAKKYNFVPNKMASRLSMKEIKIGVLLFHRFKPFYSELINGINSAHEALKDYKTKCDLRFLDKNNHDVNDCRKILKEFVNYDGIIISGLNYEDNGNIIKEIYAENNNLVLLHTYLSGKEKLFASVSDIETAAGLSAELLNNFLMFSKKKRVALFCGDMSQSVQVQRKTTFLKIAEEYGLNVCKIYETMDSDDVLKDICENDFAKIAHEIDGIYITSGNSIELCKYLEKNKLQNNIALVTVDTYPEINKYIEKGIVRATISQNVALQAKVAYENLFYHILANKQVPEIIKTKCELVMKHNLSLYK